MDPIKDFTYIDILYNKGELLVTYNIQELKEQLDWKTHILNTWTQRAYDPTHNQNKDNTPYSPRSSTPTRSNTVPSTIIHTASKTTTQTSTTIQSSNPQSSSIQQLNSHCTLNNNLNSTQQHHLSRSKHKLQNTQESHQE